MTAEAPPTAPEPAAPAPAAPAPAAPEAALPTPLRRNPFFWAAVAGLITIPLLRPLLRHIPDPPEVLGQVPDFSLVDTDGHPYTAADLQGHITVINTFFTSCQTVCPVLMQTVGRLQARLDREEDARGQPLPVHLVSISVDPTTDTPDHLRAYGQDHGVEPSRWTLLTGDEPAIRDLVVNGLMTDMGDREVDPNQADLIQISHTAKLILVDWRGRIRGYYDSTDAGLDEVFERAMRVVRQMHDER